MTFRPSPQQADVMAFVETGRGNALVEAVAGSGKTTTLIQAVMRMKGSVAFMAFNKKIAVEIEQRLKQNGVGSQVKAGTFHSFGFTAWRRAASTMSKGKSLVVEEKKLFLLQDKLAEPEWSREFTRKLVSVAKQSGVGVLCPMEDPTVWFNMVQHHDLDEVLVKERTVADLTGMVEEAMGFAKKLLQASIACDTTMIDFDDMLYCPILHKVQPWQNDWVLIDEAQDTNAVRRALAKKMLKPGGRLIAVGDRHQAIYGFTGADNDALELIGNEFACQRLPLTVTYRCPKDVVTHAQQWVSHITAHESAPAGSVTQVPEEKFLAYTADQLTAQDVILCRNTKPLIELAYHYIRNGIGCHVEGRDIGRGLLALAKRWKVQTLAELEVRLGQYLRAQTEQLMAKGQEQKAESLADRVETLVTIISQLNPTDHPQALDTAINKLFGDVEPGQPSPNLTLSTVHKAKGREWDCVYLYGRNKFMPSRFARQSWQVQQEENLMYVAVTRAKRSLVEVVVNNPPRR